MVNPVPACATGAGVANIAAQIRANMPMAPIAPEARVDIMC